MALPAFLEADVYVSLDGSGSFDGDFDRLTSDVRAEPGLAIDEGRDGAQQLNPPKIAASNFDLRNERGLYSSERADSPYYQRLLPGRPILYEAAHGERRAYRSHVAYRDHLYYRGRGIWKLGRHVLDDLDQDTEIGSRRATVSTLGYEIVLTRASVTVGVMTAPRVDECFTALLDAVNWPADKRDISVSDTTLTYWWCDDRHPWDAMLELLGAEGPGTFYVSRDGVFHFENRNYRTIATRSTDIQATYWDRLAGERTPYRAPVPYRGHRLYRGRTSTLSFERWKPASPFKSVYNRATYRTRRRVLGSLGEIWAYGADLVLTASQSVTLIVRPTDPFLDAVTPTLTTDYTVAGGTVSVSMSATSGLVAFITITATSGTPTVSGFRLRAKSLAAAGETTVENSVDASASIAAFSPIPGENIPLTLPDQNGWPEIDVPNARAVCDAWVLRQQVPRPQGTFILMGHDGESLEQVFKRRPSDRVRLVHAQSGLSADFWINGTTLRISGAAGRTVEMTVGAEKCDDLTGAVWDESEWDDLFSTWGV